MVEQVAQRLRQAGVGAVLTATDSAFGEASQIWNGAAQRVPCVIAQVATVAEVAAVIQVAADTGLPLAVRGGGHGLPGFASCDGGIVLDLSAMRQVIVDPATRTARVQGGATWGDVDAATTVHGLATTGGLISTTGVGGFTLGGGIGWLTRPHGLACDNLLSVEIVTATGEILTASAVEQPELFWALRGGGGNFGVVTSFEFRLHPISGLHAGMFLWPIERLADVGAGYRDWTATLTDEFTTMLSLFTAPDIEDMPTEIRGRLCFGVIGAHVGDPTSIEADLKPLHALDPVLADFGPSAYAEMQTMFDADWPAGDRYFFTGGFSDGLSTGFLDQLIAAVSARPGARCGVDIHHMGGAAARVSESDSAYAGRHANYTYNIIAGWEDPADDQQYAAWARSTRSALTPFSVERGYVNFATDHTPDGVEQLYGTTRYQRLQQAKRTWDPHNLFRLNQNIVP